MNFETVYDNNVQDIVDKWLKNYDVVVVLIVVKLVWQRTGSLYSHIVDKVENNNYNIRKIEESTLNWRRSKEDGTNTERDEKVISRSFSSAAIFIPSFKVAGDDISVERIYFLVKENMDRHR